MKTLLVLMITALCCSCATHKSTHNKVSWEDDIHNPDNAEFVEEVAFNLGIPVGKVTQADFNYRYLDMEGSKVPVESGPPNTGSTVKISNIVPDGTQK